MAAGVTLTMDPAPLERTATDASEIVELYFLLKFLNASNLLSFFTSSAKSKGSDWPFDPVPQSLLEIVVCVCGICVIRICLWGLLLEEVFDSHFLVESINVS